ncbi:unnamed protein product [Ilex paraguariensis]|uniref:Uncharacterized protein n=1 Tax=Ilex paraguariensis TaxID=185542 RepID=A0ABC8R5Z8_9AQUA
MFPLQAIMPLCVCLSIFRRLSKWRPLLFYTMAWTVLLTATVAVASFSAEIAFVIAVSPSSSFSRPCNVVRTRIPVDVRVLAGSLGEEVWFGCHCANRFCCFGCGRFYMHDSSRGLVKLTKAVDLI